MNPIDIASRTKLPPSTSPELRALGSSVDHHHDTAAAQAPSSSSSLLLSHKSRLRSIARYASFRPQALCCSPPIAQSGSASENLLASSTTTAKKTGQASSEGNNNSGLTSVGAICGDKGVALFRVSQPHVPILLLRHASRPTSGGVTSLAFQPNCPSAHRGGSTTLHLGAARGSSVLVWDASGHSLSPLIGRLGVGHSVSFDLGGGSADDESSKQITSLAWQRSEATSSPWLAAATASHACLWDLREATSGTTATAFSKPSLRFGAAAAAGSRRPLSPYVQLAASQNDECALLDSKGVIRIFDLRMPEQRGGRRSTAGILGAFRAFHHAGIGLSCLNNNTSSDDQHGGGNTQWLSWGLDGHGPDANALVKIWTNSSGGGGGETSSPNAENFSSADYWYMDNSPDLLLGSASREGGTDFRLVGHCTTPNLACARVCPIPEENSFVTIGQEVEANESGTPTQWKAELWKLTEDSELNKVVSFNVGDDANRSIASMMGKDASGLGQLMGAELALSSVPRLVESDVDMEYTMIDKSPTRGLLLVSLTENGFVTTHSIPEAVPDTPVDESLLSDATRPGQPVIPPKVFPDEKDWSVGDAAAAWGPSDDLISREVRSTVEKTDFRAAPSTGDGGMVPFEMDFPVADPIASGNLPALQMPRVDMASPSGSSIVLNASLQDATESADDVRDSTPLMDSVERLGIPCPRLCGATFSPVIGGLVAFNNGEVKKMWTWYSSSTRSADAATNRGAASNTKLPHGDDVMFLDTSTVRDSPRTLQDLIEMTKAAKEAQWGDQMDEASSAGTPQVEDNFFEDASDEESSDSDEGESDDLADAHGGKLPKSNIYDRYFGEFRRPLTKPSSSDGSKERSIKRTNTGGNLAGPSSDMLSPVVRVNRDFDRMSLNNQSQSLACQLDLGRWMEFRDVVPDASELDESNEMTVSAQSNQALDLLPESPSLRGRSRNRFVTHSPPRDHMRHATSDPLLGVQPPTLVGNTAPYRDEEKGVRGGEYSVRPHVQESMVFLRKLFTHQQAGGSGFSGVPPDGPLLPNSLSPLGKRQATPVASPPATKTKEEPSIPQPGVYTLQADGLASQTSVHDNLVETKMICLYNAAVCEKLGEPEKGDTWELLAQVVDGRLTEMSFANDQWRPRPSDALGSSLVSNILRYYESLGDVQMLSTIVCVLRSDVQGSNHRSKTSFSYDSLLPEGENEKYDTYLRRYSDILYGWGLLSLRAELNKHLVRVIQPRECFRRVIAQTSADESKAPGIALVFTCPTCGEDTDFGTNQCRSCHDFAFRCIICDQAVRGLLSVCDRETCGHGGHPSCLKEWFHRHKECPSGCGCKCTLLAPAMTATEPVVPVNEFI